MAGRRAGTKRSDRRWIDARGQEWASKLEATVFEGLSADNRLIVERCGEGDSFSYTTPVRNGECVGCGSRKVVQARVYTPDLRIIPEARRDDGRWRYLEIKGYFSGQKRQLLRHFLKTGPGIDLHLVLERNGRATRSLNMGEYIERYMKIPWTVWDGRLPEAWYE